MLLPPPTRPIVPKKDYGKKRNIYTIHDTNDNAFCLQMQQSSTQQLKTTLVSFNKRKDALLYACMLESHKAQTKSWPDPTMGEDMRMFVMANDLNMSTVPSELYIKSWDNIALKMFCMRHIVDLLFLKTVEKTNNNTINIEGSIIKIDSDPALYIEVYNELYYRV